MNEHGLGTDVWSVPFDDITTLLKVSATFHLTTTRSLIVLDILLGGGRLLGSAPCCQDLPTADISALLPGSTLPSGVLRCYGSQRGACHSLRADIGLAVCTNTSCLGEVDVQRFIADAWTLQRHQRSRLGFSRCQYGA